MKRFFALSIMFLTTLALAGDEKDEGPRTPAAKGALVKLEQAREKARVEYERAVAKAEDEAVRELEKARAEVMKKGGEDALAEAVRIQNAIDGIAAVGPIRAGRVVLLIKGEAIVYLNDKPIGKAQSGQLLNVALPRDATGEIVIRAKSDVVYRSMRLAIVDNKGRVIRGMKASDVGAEQKAPDAGFADLWVAQLKDDTSEWVYLPEKGKEVVFKFAL